jgi:predicted small metal-binding protein
MVDEVPNRRSDRVKTFACGAVVAGCTASFTAESEEGILEQVAQHARDEHGLSEVPDELVREVRANIR